MDSKAKVDEEAEKFQREMEKYHQQIEKETKTRIENKKANLNIGRCEYCSIRTDQLPDNSKLFLCSGCMHVLANLSILYIIYSL
jgi:argininosuccinate lyase